VPNALKGEAPLQAAPPDYRLICDLVSDWMFEVTVDANRGLLVEWISDGFTKATGYTIDDIRTPEKWERIVLTADIAELREFFEAAVSGERRRLDFRLKTKAGGRLWVRMTARPRNAEEQPVRSILGAVVNVTKETTDARKLAEYRRKLIGEIVMRERAQEAAEAALAEKSALLGELHHRVKNNLQVISSFLRLQLLNAEDPHLREVLGEARSRIRSIALVHETLYGENNMDRADLGEYTKSIAGNLYRVYGISPDNVKLSLEIASVPMRIEKAVPCGLVLNELISNALKHAFPPDGPTGRIAVGIKPDEAGNVRMEVKDDGVGFPAGYDPNESRSLGLRLVRMLAQDQLHGNFEVSNSNGTTAVLTFPVTAGKYADR